VLLPRAQGHSTAEHVLVFWVGPFMGAVLAGTLWRLRSSSNSKPARAAADKEL
jgi:glycerol uptake facilitator-like aquaporin